MTIYFPIILKDLHHPVVIMCDATNVARHGHDGQAPGAGGNVPQIFDRKRGIFLFERFISSSLDNISCLDHGVGHKQDVPEG